MSRNFDLNSFAERSELQQWLRSYSKNKWQEFLDFCYSDEFKRNFTYEDRENMSIVRKFLNIRGDLSTQQLKRVIWSYNIIERINNLKNTENQKSDLINEEDLNMPLCHFTLRVAWHDNKWNGTVCKEPEKNIYCNGYHSLLSDRIRREKEKLLLIEKQFAGKPVLEMLKETGKIPPCYWSINIYGDETIPVKHINPAAPKVLNPIEDQLVPYSMFSWPFGMSFVRKLEDYRTNGKYWGNFDKKRVPRFRSKIKKGKSIGFLYAKFSNPLSYEDFKYLLIGCGMIEDIGDKSTFEPEEEINKIRNHPFKKELRNFPKTNWVIKYQFNPDTIVRIPYQEYIEEAQRRGLDSDDTVKFLDNIKVTIDEPELEHCFKFVNMDIDDDDVIFLLTKLKNTLINISNDGIVENNFLAENLKRVENLIEYCWSSRSHFPGFSKLSRILLYINESEKCSLDSFVEFVKQNESNYYKKIKELLHNPNCDDNYNKYRGKLNELKEELDMRVIDINQFLTLAMLNLSLRQFEKIFKKETGNQNLEIKDFCNNLYLLYEEYNVDNDPQDKITGDFVDHPIGLFKIDIALFPYQEYLNKIDLQEEYKIHDRRRVRSLIIQYLKSLEYYTGDCFDDAQKIQKYIEDFPLFYKSTKASLKLPELFLEKRDNEYDSHLIEKIKIVNANNKKYYYLDYVYQAEKDIQDFILKLVNTKEANNIKFEDINEYIQDSINLLKSRIGNSFDDGQFSEERLKLYENIFPKRFFILLGNPGSGKSYEILNIIKFLVLKGESYILLAPTGKAALRLKSDELFKEAGITAMTIDKFIKQWEYDKKTRKKYNNIIIDEMSMVDLRKLHKLLNFFEPSDPTFHRLIFVGDVNQLPPIGYGKPFYDIINFIKSDNKYSSNLTELEVNCRQEMEGNEILNFSKYLTGEIELSEEQIRRIESGGQISNGFKIHYWENEIQLENLLKTEFNNLCDDLKIIGSDAEKLDLIFNIKSPENENHPDYDVEKFQVITPYRSYSDNINNHFQSKIKSDIETNILDLFKNHDKIIRVQNYYWNNELILSNGSIGLAFETKNEGKLFFSELEDKFINIGGENGIYEREKEFFELAYCITIHKSQGSGFEHLFVVLPKKYGILCKELFYTALTRSKKSITIFVEGVCNDDFSKSLFEYSRKRNYTEKRNTSLMLDAPHLYYGLEPDPGVYVQSRVEQIIYMHLKKYKEKFGESHGFDFDYEEYPVVDNNKIRIKTDFTIYIKNNIYYWEHLGLLSKNYYKNNWLEIKLPEYKSNGLLDNLITTDELNGISDEKIKKIVDDIFNNNLGNEDKYKKYSKHHYSLR